MKTAVDYLIIGAGGLGLSLAYNLAKKGAKDIAVVEQKYIGYHTGRCGSGIRQQFARLERLIMGRESVRLWKTLSEELGSDCRFEQKGYAYALYDQDWVPRYKAYAKMHNENGVPTQVISGQELKEIIPGLNTEGIYAACYNATDGKADPFGTCSAYAIAARRLGVNIYEYTGVQDLRELPGGRWEALTNKGVFQANTLIITAGCWSSILGRMIDVEIPIQPFVEEAFVTEPVAPGYLDPLLNIKTPRYNDAWFTQTTVNNGIVVGWGHAQWVPEGKTSYEMTTTQSYLKTACWNLARALPALANVNIVRHFAGFFEVIPDREPILSRIEDRNLYVGMGTGFMHITIGGQGLAELILDGACTCIPMDYFSMERFKGEVSIMPY